MNIDRRHFLGLVAAGTAVALARPSRAAATDNIELEEITVGDLQEGMRAGRFTSRSIAEAYLQRIDAIDKRGPAINAILELNPDALAIAEERDRERKAGPVRGPLHGIPLLIKDNIDTADRMHTSAGSLALAESIAARDAAVDSSVSATAPSNVPLTVFWMVGRMRVPVMAASHVGFSAFQFVTMAPPLESEYQTGFDSSRSPA